MNVVIPLGGVGSRFQKEGYYQRPKPFIPVLGKPMLRWVTDNLELNPDDTLIIVYNPVRLFSTQCENCYYVSDVHVHGS